MRHAGDTTERLGGAPGVRYPWLDERAIARVADGVLVVSAAVEAVADSGGAGVRIPFTCRARWLGGGRWLGQGTGVRLP